MRLADTFRKEADEFQEKKRKAIECIKKEFQQYIDDGKFEQDLLNHFIVKGNKSKRQGAINIKVYIAQSMIKIVNFEFTFQNLTIPFEEIKDDVVYELTQITIKNLKVMGFEKVDYMKHANFNSWNKVYFEW